MDGGSIASLRRANQEWVTEGTAIHEEIRLPAAGPRIRGPLDEPADTHVTYTALDRDQL